MPYISISTSKILTEDQKTALKTELGRKISIIPGKAEVRLMVDISDGHDMYLAGEKRDLAYLDVRGYGSSELADKKAFTEAVFVAVQEITGLPQNGIYLTYTEFANWGTLGSMK